MRDILGSINAMSRLEIPKARRSLEDVQSEYGPIAEETRKSWLVPCSHTFFPAAPTASIEHTESELGFAIPSAYKQLLGITNGAKLFCVKQKWSEDISPGALDIRYHLFGCDELVEVNTGLLASFRKFYAKDPEYKDCHQLNYLAFCDADGDYQSLLLDEPKDPQVFLLCHEFAYRPYDVRDADLNYKLADSLRSWLELICKSGGWEGRGMQTGDL